MDKKKYKININLKFLNVSYLFKFEDLKNEIIFNF
jgi:hypothetical protein